MAAVKSEMSKEDIRAREEEDFAIGPLSILTHSVKRRAQVLVNCRNNRKFLARVVAFDMHLNMLLEDVSKMWTEFPKHGEAVQRDRYVGKMFVRGDCVILVVNPIAQDGGGVEAETKKRARTRWG